MSTLPKPTTERKKMKAASGGDRLSDLPDSVLLHILSLLTKMKEIARTSVLSTRWRFLWKSVPLSLDLTSLLDKEFPDSLYSANKKLYYARFFLKTRKVRVVSGFDPRYAKAVGLWVHFATQIANVEDFTLHFDSFFFRYVFPQFAFKNSSLKNLVLHSCELEPSVSVSWTSLISLTIGDLKLTDRVMEVVLSGCPNLEFLKLDSFLGLHYLEIRSPKLETLIIKSHYTNEDDLRMEVVIPHVQCLQLLGSSHERAVRLTNVASVVTMLVDNYYFHWDDNDTVDKDCKYLKEVLHSLVHAKNVELGRWCIELLSVLVLDGWQAPASSRRSLTLKAGLVQQHFPAICSLLQSSPDLETFIIDWSWQSVRDLPSRLINEDEDGKKFEKHIFDCSLLHLRTIKIINFYVPLGSNKFIMPLVKYLLKNAEVLEKMVITARLCPDKVKESDVSLGFNEMALEFLSFPRSSKHAAVVFSYLKPSAALVCIDCNLRHI